MMTMMTMNETDHETAIQNYVNWMYGWECGYWAEHHPEKWAQRTDELLEDFKIRLRGQAESQLERILDKEKCYSAMRNGAFDPRNRATRQLFFDLTGIKLGKTRRETDQQVKEYIGQELIAEIEQEKQQKIAQKEKEREEAKQKAIQEQRERIIGHIQAGEPVSGSDLVWIAEYLGVSMPIRTKGAILARIVSMTKEQSRIRPNKSGKFSKFSGHYEVYAKVLRKLEEQSETKKEI